MSVSLWAYDPARCDGKPCPHNCDKCPHREDTGDIQLVDSVLYEEVERHDNCTVQVLKNTVTGELSVGWWINNAKKQPNDEVESQNDYIE